MDNKALVPEYMTRFQCIGSECEDTCCALWNVSVDQATYNRYQKVQHPTLKKQFKSDVVVNKAGDRTQKRYATMKLEPSSGDCCFNDKGLCSIQKELGESYLSPTCATYPRKVNEINGEQEVSAVLSCPEAARLALIEPKGMEFVYVDAYTQRNLQWNARVVTDSPNATLTAKHFWPLRTISIEILQNRKLNLSHRFMLLTILADRIDESIERFGDTQIEDILEQFQSELTQENGIMDSAIFPSNGHFQLKFLNDILTTFVEQNLWYNRRYKECLDQYLKGMQATEGSKVEETVSAYEAIRNDYYASFMNEHEYMLENYLVNYIYSTMFPISTKETMFEKVRYIGIVFALIRMHLIGMSAFNKGLTANLVIQLIQSFTKNFAHTNKFKELIEKKCQQEDITLGHLSLLIMD